MNTQESSIRRIQKKIDVHTYEPPIILVFLDSRGAFDSVDRFVLLETLAHQGMPRKFVNIIRSLYSQTSGRVSGELSKSFRTQSGVRSRTFRQTTYSHIMTNEEYIRPRTLVEYTPNPMCVEQLNCSSCLALSHPDGFHCAWCPKAQRCSDGYDPYTADWISKKCDVKNVTENCFEWSTATKTTNTAPKQQTLTSVNTTPASINTERLMRNKTMNGNSMRTDTIDRITSAPDNTTVSRATSDGSSENADAAGTTEVETRVMEGEPKTASRTAVNTLISTNSMPGLATNSPQNVDGDEQALTNTVLLSTLTAGNGDATNPTTLKSWIQTPFPSDTRKTETDEFSTGATTTGGLQTAETSDVVQTTVSSRNESAVPCTDVRSSCCAISGSRTLVLCVLLPLVVAILSLFLCTLALCTWKRRHRHVLRSQKPQHDQHKQAESTVSDSVKESVPEKRASCERRLTIYTCSSCGGVTRVAATGRTNSEKPTVDEPLQSQPKSSQ
ncbi:hypothetical protein T265_03467 [Opisthorchis viverrini]|uniref:PSI domain-containing protein n=1 Tax=Opisthorchis viverrini TaxID=6198 RepID=A0A075AHJ3_OPIVI|nr:hypothetical protein T265_03467 [Opisthorchis viverrini]KER29984.1 hypothetical protein T265_03467 [Opisthorchis viverrini]